MVKSQEQLMEDWKRDEFGQCKKCKKRFDYDDKFIEVAEGTCGSSQGNPCAYVDTPERYCVRCYTPTKL
jgi:hypothetical protein